MEWDVSFASNLWNVKSKKIVINTLKDLQALAEKYKERLIVDFAKHEIIVYDYYVE